MKGLVLARPAMICLLVTLSMAGLGCAARPQNNRFLHVPNAHLLFDPHAVATQASAIRRSGWPETTAYTAGEETLTWREVVIDRQNGRGYHDDNLYRRFESVRVGRSRR